jgi:uncharacterized protein YbbC (DUF1343 family)
VCGGVQIHVTDPVAFRPYTAYLALVALARAQDPAAFGFRTEMYEFRDDVPAFDLLTGSAEARERMVRGEAALEIARAGASVDAADRAIVQEAVEAGRARAL